MKKNFRLILLLCCLSILIFGVYAVSKSANLNISGTIGLNAHNCEVLVSATITGDAVFKQSTKDEIIYTQDKNGFPSEERILFENEILDGSSYDTLSKEKDIGLIYFSDLTQDGLPARITVKFEIKNLSDFEIYVKIKNPEIENVTCLSFEQDCEPSEDEQKG